MRKLLNYIYPTLLYFVLAGTASAYEATFFWFGNNNSTTGSSGLTSGGTCSMTGLTTLKDIIMRFVVGCIISRTIYFLIGLAVIVFIFGIFKMISSEGNEKQGGRELMLWGVIGIFVMISVWGLVAILQGTFGLEGNFNITPRSVPINYSR